MDTQPTTRDLVAFILSEIEHEYAASRYGGMQFAVDEHEYSLIVDKTRGSVATATLYRDTEDDPALEVMTLEIAVRVTSITDRTHPDYDPTDADLAPRWGSLSVAEQHAVAGRIKQGLKDGAA